ncbi:glycohydrolase toxin TNT-related protein [Mycobacterium sp. CVI_P3]|uniref:Glycohydrolase toxin TNT-related protein n=1 Tax=Mycobacterium pinniadriaticum TaxID=2994102 RepID=A0ABT3SMB6_9MYCO|nr:glycohydrolase toxin TNT-related protein [Mycobacterium pinniadriaticum]MCX2934247.1 glycohydrolase toxin TNT-related protein [Mycobacterium pinniadriaticum]MCX2940669.1 glycohydrolase toxin TNT-related protein [Mycobacterium pinniadriaticum]
MLWYLVEFLVGDWWPNGEPSELRAAAAAWNALAAQLYRVTGENAGPYAVIDAQQMPDKEPMKTAVRDVGTAMSSLAGEAQRLGAELSSFATDVETTQNAIRDLLHKLSSVVGSVADRGILGTVFELITGDAEEKIQEVANDIKAVMANHRRQSAARKELLAQLASSIKNYTRAIEIITRVELVNYLGEDAGRIVANVGDALTDTSVGLAVGGINTVGIVTGFDPVGDPQGTWAMIEGLNKMAETFNPMTAPTAFAMDPKGSVDMLKNVTHFDDIFTSNRPFIGVGELGFDIGTAVIPGGAGVKAAGGARAAEGAAARAEITSTERAAGEAAEIASATTGLRGVSRDVESVTSKLDDLNKTGLDGGKPPSGSPGLLPKAFEPPTPPVTRHPGPSDAPGAPTSAPAPKAEVPSAPAGSEVAAPSGGRSGPSAPSDPPSTAPGTGTSGVNHPGAMPHDSGGGPHDAGIPHDGGGVHGGGAKVEDGSGAPHDGGTGVHDGGVSDSPNPGPHPLPPDSPLFDGYVPHDPGPEFTDADGNLIYPDDTDPAKPYAAPGSVVSHVDLARGTLMDRFGFPGGAWLSPDGTLFSFRGLPHESALKPYFQYVVDDPTKLPPGWSIEQSTVAPWFHQPGGGVQYRIIAPEGERPSVQTLLDWGYLKEVHT